MCLPDPDLFRRSVMIAVNLPSWIRNPAEKSTAAEVQANAGRLSKLCLALADAQRRFERGIERQGRIKLDFGTEAPLVERI